MVFFIYLLVKPKILVLREARCALVLVYEESTFQFVAHVFGK